jgi:single-stranded DNA-binding protein
MHAASSPQTRRNVEVFGDLAGRVAESAGKGQRLIIVGRTTTRVWNDPDEQPAPRVAFNADDVALSWKYGPHREAARNGSCPSGTQGRGRR